MIPVCDDAEYIEEREAEWALLEERGESEACDD